LIAFAFYRFRFHFRALDAVHFPAGKSTNVIRGAFGSVLRDTAPPADYARLFEPGRALGAAPSGLADWPRPFLFRASHLDGLTIRSGSPFAFDVHVFDVRSPALEHFREALSRLAAQGLGPARGRAELARVEHLDLDDQAGDAAAAALPPNELVLDPDAAPVGRVRLRFLTPTELKSGSRPAERPEFPTLFGRLRDRISTLRALYGDGPLEIDFRAMGERAAAIRLRSSRLSWERVERKSGRTGQVHPLGGFTGEAEYEGPLAEFLPWLRAARWVGVGRQTVWGKGDVRVVT